MTAVETVLRFSAQDWARSRFVRPRLWDTVGAVRVLTIPAMQQLHQPWLAGIDVPEVIRVLPTLVALNPASGWIPDFLVPPARSTTASLDDELAAVAAYPLELITADLQRGLKSRLTPKRAAVLAPLIADPAAARERILAELATAWGLLLAPIWPRIDELITADIAHRGSVIARAGLAAALDDLYSEVTCEGDSLRVRRGDPITVHLAGQGLALLPSAFVWPVAVVIHGDAAGWPPTLAYPAHGVAAMWTEPPRAPNSLASLFGGTRAALLTDLGRARTTRELAERHRLAAGTVSEHLTALRSGALLTRRRDGKHVRYQRSPLGDQLLRANASGDIPIRDVHHGCAGTQPTGTTGHVGRYPTHWSSGGVPLDAGRRLPTVAR